MSRPANALPYYGGKSGWGRHASVSSWVAAALPGRPGYCEPFCGMLGVLLQRARAAREVANDADRLIVNWWRVVREKPGRLEHWVEHTPTGSRAEFLRARSVIRTLEAPGDASDPSVVLAWAVFVMLLNSATHSIHNSATCGVKYETKGAHRGRPAIRRLARRIREVQFETQDAGALLERLSERSDYSIYCDPPYRDAETRAYCSDIADRGSFAELLRAQRSAVAVSGYGDEWDCLGWERKEFPRSVVLTPTEKRVERLEVVWTNFAPERKLFG